MPDMDNATVGRIKDVADGVSDSTDSGSKKKKKKTGKSSNAAGQQDDVLDDKSRDSNEYDENGSKSSDVLADTDADDEKSKNNPMKTMSKVGTAVQGAQAAHKALLLAKFIQWLKMMLQMLQQMIAAAVQAVAGFVQTIITAVVNVATTIATALGVSVVATLFGGVVAVVLVVGLVVGAVVNGMQANELSKLDSGIVDCSVAVNKVRDDVAGGEINVSEQQLKNAQLAYSFLSAYGVSDEHIAGILGNWQTESAIDPTSVEGIYGSVWHEQYIIGPAKQAAWDANFNSYEIVMYPAGYNGRTTDWTLADEYNQHDDWAAPPDIAGIGLGGWTYGRNTDLLNCAASIGLEWYTMEAQLIYCVTTDMSADWLNWWFQQPVSSVEEATTQFYCAWERGNSNLDVTTDSVAIANLPYRIDFAENWYVLMADWEVDTEYANSLMDLADLARLNASGNAVTNALSNCQKLSSNVNESIARAAVSYAYPDYQDSFENNGTPLYQYIHDKVMTADPNGEREVWELVNAEGIDRYYASCDRSVVTAILWAGADDEMPWGSPVVIYYHMVANSSIMPGLEPSDWKWEQVYEIWDWDVNKIDELLQPGDILVSPNTKSDKYPDGNEHILMYVGNDLIREIHGDALIDSLPNGDRLNCVEGSIGEASTGNNRRSPGCTWYWYGNEYYVWRCIQYDENSVHTNAHDGYTGTIPGK